MYPRGRNNNDPIPRPQYYAESVEGVCITENVGTYMMIGVMRTMYARTGLESMYLIG
jgi:hypothetical protein